MELARGRAPDADAPVPGARRAPRVAERAAGDALAVAAVRREHGARGRVPDARRAVPRPRDEAAVAAVRERAAVDRAAVALERALERAGRRVPEPRAVVPAAREQPRAVAAEGAALDAVADDRRHRPRAVPDARLAALAAGDDARAVARDGDVVDAARRQQAALAAARARRAPHTEDHAGCHIVTAFGASIEASTEASTGLPRRRDRLAMASRPGRRREDERKAQTAKKKKAPTSVRKWPGAAPRRRSLSTGRASCRCRRGASGRGRRARRGPPCPGTSRRRRWAASR